MNQQVIEMAEIKLAKGKTEADLIAGAEQMREGFLSQQPGFVSHDLVSMGDGKYADIVRWESDEKAREAMGNAESSSACASYFTLMEFDPEDPHDGVTHFTVLSGPGAK
ncbi:MAG: antibiotic biosynthesis monooxygenase [Pseudomonadota bacterium]